MAETPIPSSQHYVMVIDKKSDDLIRAMFQTCTYVPGAFPYFQTVCHGAGISDEDILAFFREKSDKTHGMGWCEDKNCKVPNGNPV